MDEYLHLEEEELIVKLYEDVIRENSELKDGEVNVNVGEGQHVNMNASDVEDQHGSMNVNVGEVHNDDVSSNGSENESFNYDSALEVTFDDDFDESDGFVEEGVGNLIDYEHGQDGTRK